MFSLIVPVLLLAAGPGLLLGAVAALERGGPVRGAWRARRLADGAGGGLAHASVTDAGAPPVMEHGDRAPVDGATSPPSYPGGS